MTAVGPIQGKAPGLQQLSTRLQSVLAARSEPPAPGGIFGARSVEGLRGLLGQSRVPPLGTGRIPRPRPPVGGAPEGMRRRISPERLGDAIRNLESMQETVRNKRQMASTEFQNFDQKANQLYNLLSSVMKAMNEMRMGTVRNML